MTGPSHRHNIDLAMSDRMATTSGQNPIRGYVHSRMNTTVNIDSNNNSNTNDNNHNTNADNKERNDDVNADAPSPHIILRSTEKTSSALPRYRTRTNSSLIDTKQNENRTQISNNVSSTPKPKKGRVIISSPIDYVLNTMVSQNAADTSSSSSDDEEPPDIHDTNNNNNNDNNNNNKHNNSTKVTSSDKRKSGHDDTHGRSVLHERSSSQNASRCSWVCDWGQDTISSVNTPYPSEDKLIVFSDVMHGFSLRYHMKDWEEEYTRYNLRFFPLRMLICGGVMTIILWVSWAVFDYHCYFSQHCIFTRNIPLSVAFHVCCAITTFFAILSAFTGIFCKLMFKKCTGVTPDHFIMTLLTMMQVVVGVTYIYAIIELVGSNEVGLFFFSAVLAQNLIAQMLMWVSVYVVVIDFLTPVRVGISVYTHVIFFVIQVICFVVTKVLQETDFRFGNSIEALAFDLTSNDLLLLMPIVMLPLGFTARWSIEQAHRWSFYRNHLQQLVIPFSGEGTKTNAERLSLCLTVLEAYTIDTPVCKLARYCQSVLSNPESLFGEAKWPSVPTAYCLQPYMNEPSTHTHTPNRSSIDSDTDIHTQYTHPQNTHTQSLNKIRRVSLRVFGKHKPDIVSQFAVKEIVSSDVTVDQQIGQVWDLPFTTRGKTSRFGFLVEAGYSLLEQVFCQSSGARTHAHIQTHTRTQPHTHTESAELGHFPSEITMRLLLSMHQNYLDNPYHNAIHGGHVAHACVSLARYVGLYDKLESLEKVTLIIAALGHDIGHPGRKNDFFVNTSSDVAITYNDASVLEHLHCRILFSILQRPECNIFATYSGSAWQSIRKPMIELILATDLQYHFYHFAVCELRMSANRYKFKSREDKWLACRLIIKASDLAYSTLSDEVEYLEWTRRVYEEFYKQGDDEERMGLEKSFLCDRAIDKTPFWYNMQNAFLTSFIRPMYVNLAKLEVQMCMSRTGLDKTQFDDEEKNQQHSSEKLKRKLLLHSYNFKFKSESMVKKTIIYSRCVQTLDDNAARMKKKGEELQNIADSKGDVNNNNSNDNNKEIINNNNHNNRNRNSNLSKPRDSITEETVGEVASTPRHTSVIVNT